MLSHLPQAHKKSCTRTSQETSSGRRASHADPRSSPDPMQQSANRTQHISLHHAPNSGLRGPRPHLRPCPRPVQLSLQDFLYLSYSSCACHTYVTSSSGEQYRTLSKQQSPPPAQSRVPHANPRVRGSTEKKQATLSSCVKICTRFRSAFLLCAPETGISVLVAPEYALRATLRATAWPKRLPPGLRFTFHPRHGRVAEVRI